MLELKHFGANSSCRGATLTIWRDIRAYTIEEFIWTQLKSVSVSLGEISYAPLFRKILVSVKFVSAILGPEMAAPILWTPGKMRSFCRKNRVHKIPRFRGGGDLGFFGGGSADFIFYGRADFSDLFLGTPQNPHN